MIRVYNGYTTGFGGGLRCRAGEAWGEGKHIACVGSARTERPAFERESDQKGDVILTGFKNAHTHTVLTLFLSLENCDDLTGGKPADLIALELSPPNRQPMNNICKNIVYSGSKSNVYLTVVKGEFLCENGEYHIGETAETIDRQAKSITERIIK